MRIVLIAGLLLLIIIACTPQTESNPTLDLRNVQSILPTLPPEEVIAAAQLADEATLAQGQAIYAQHCAVCHGANGEGQFPDDPFNKGPDDRFGAPPHNDSGHTWHHDDDLLFSYVKNGGMGSPEVFYIMPPLGEVLADEDIWAVIAYIKSTWTEEHRRIQAERTLNSRQNE